MQFNKKTYQFSVTPGGAKYDINSYSFFNNPGDKTYYIQANIHGIEIAGTPVIYELMEYIEKTNVKINIICVPIANPFGLDSQIMGIQTGYNNIHTNAYNCLNYNRIGEKNPQLFEAELNNILLEISKSADVVIDLHSAGYESQEHMYCHEKFLETAKYFGINNIIYRRELGNAFEDLCYKAGKESYTLELGASRRIEAERIQYFLDKIINFIQKKENTNNKSLSTYKIETLEGKIFSPTAGILVWEKQIGEQVLKGDKLGTIYNVDGKHHLISLYEGLFLIKNPIHAPYKNQNLGQILTKVK